jgi:predicted lipoprotein with Yx(FWY)xxD motif
MRLGLIGLAVACLLSAGACSSGSASQRDHVVAAAPTTTIAAIADAPSPTSTTLAPATTTTAAAARSHATTSAPRSAAAGAAATTTVAPSGTVVSSTNNTSYGAILVDGNGRTLYLFTPDDGMSTPQCTGSCAQTWPPLKASGAPRAEGGAQQSMLGVESGQVTYNGHPLYLYAGDSAPGQTNGQGVGGIWYVVSTSGDPVLR